MITIERANALNYKDMVALFNDYRMFYQQPSDAQLADQFIRQRIENNESIIFSAYDGDKVGGKAVGFSQLFIHFSTVKAEKRVYLADLFVDEQYRKQGIATALINQSIGFAKENNAKLIELKTATSNATAQRLYENLGFSESVTISLKSYELQV